MIDHRTLVIIFIKKLKKHVNIINLFDANLTEFDSIAIQTFALFI